MKFVDKQLALKLKEKGFDKPCFGWYYIDTPTGLTEGAIVYYKYHFRGAIYRDCLRIGKQWNPTRNSVDAPTIDQVLEWLRERGIFVWVKPYHTFATKNNVAWDWNIAVVDDYAKELLRTTSDDMIADYDDACIAAIEYVLNLDNLM